MGSVEEYGINVTRAIISTARCMSVVDNDFHSSELTMRTIVQRGLRAPITRQRNGDLR
jgi:hypothetical protein